MLSENDRIAFSPSGVHVVDFRMDCSSAGLHFGGGGGPPLLLPGIMAITHHAAATLWRAPAASKSKAIRCNNDGKTSLGDTHFDNPFIANAAHTRYECVRSSNSKLSLAEHLHASKYGPVSAVEWQYLYDNSDHVRAREQKEDNNKRASERSP